MALAPFVAGAIAGYAIAIPVGAVAVLIIDLGMRRGFRVGAAAGAGAATADFLYAILAMAGGTAIAAVLAPWSTPLRAVAAAVLLAIGIRGLVGVARARARAARRDGAAPDPSAPAGLPGTAPRRELVATWLRFVGITILNPSTVVYFAALILGLPDLGPGIATRLEFVVGAGLASLSWQTLLAAAGAVARHRLPPRFQVGISVLGNVIICAFAVGIARDLL